MSTKPLYVSRSQNIRQSLHLSIDPSPYAYHANHDFSSPDSSSSSPSSSTRASIATSIQSGVTPTSALIQDFSVLCLYDFDSADPDHLPFRKNEILDVVKQEDTGWWAAMRPGGYKVGWIPHAFVEPLSDDMADRLRNVREEVRIFEYEAEQLYTHAPTQQLSYLYESASEPSHSPTLDEWLLMNEPPQSLTVQVVTPTNMTRPRDFPVSAPIEIGRNAKSRLQDSDAGRRFPTPPSPVVPIPPPPRMSPRNKPTPPTPVSDEFDEIPRQSPPQSSRNRRRPGPVAFTDRDLSRLSTLIDSNNMDDVDRITSPDSAGSGRRSRDKIKQLTGSDEARAYAEAIQRQAWYLRPLHGHELKVDREGNIKSGTLDALVEKLASDSLANDPLKLAQDTLFRNIFLMTFRTFTTADTLFDMLVDHYRLDHPENLTDDEFEEWKKKKHDPMQRQVLTVFTAWLEDHSLLEEEPHIARRLSDFLALIVTPSSLATTAKLIVQTIERLTFANPVDTIAFSTPPRKRRKSKAHKNDLLRFDPTDIAEQLCLYEHSMYTKVRKQECLTWTKTQTGRAVMNLSAFCSTHDKLASWVKISVLTNESLSKRADTVEFWIKVAEKCRTLNNFASMSAIINALSSTVVSRLHLTWAHVGRKSHLDALLKFNEPTGAFAGYRSLLQGVDGPCVPFIGMFLTELVHLNDQYHDDLSDPARPCIAWAQRQRWYEVVSKMLGHQSRRYHIAESESTQTFIAGNLVAAGVKDPSWFWTQSQEVQQAELAHADIRKGLERAGF